MMVVEKSFLLREHNFWEGKFIHKHGVLSIHTQWLLYG
jgi:hypothetical protein